MHQFCSYQYLAQVCVHCKIPNYALCEWVQQVRVCVCAPYAEETWHHCIDAPREGQPNARHVHLVRGPSSNPTHLQVSWGTWLLHTLRLGTNPWTILPYSFSISGQMVRQVIFRHYQIFIWICFWLICQTQQKYWQIVRRQRCLQIVCDVRKSMVLQSNCSKQEELRCSGGANPPRSLKSEATLHPSVSARWFVAIIPSCCVFQTSLPRFAGQDYKVNVEQCSIIRYIAL